MVGWHHRLDGHAFEQALGIGDGQGSLVCCSLWGCKEPDTTERLNQNSMLVLEGLLLRRGLAEAHHREGALAAAVLEGPPWHKPSWRSPLTLGSVQFSHLVMSDSLQPHGLQHARLPCP